MKYHYRDRRYYTLKNSPNPTGSKKAGIYIPYFLIAFFFFSGLVVIIWQQVYIIRISYEIQKLEETHRDLTRLNKGLRLQLLSLGRLERIEQVAEENLGLLPPEHNQMVIVK